MNIALVSHSAVVDVYQDKFRYLSSFPDVRLTVIIPEAYREGRDIVRGFEGTGGYTVVRLPVLFGTGGRQNLHFYRSLLPALRQARPDILHLEEEPESLVTAQGLYCAGRLSPRPKTIIYTWRNIIRTHREWSRLRPQRYIYPLVERYVLPRADHIVAGNQEVVDVARALGWQHPMSIIPHGIDPALYTPAPADEALKHRLGLRGTVIGFIGRMLHMKGVESLIRGYAATLAAVPDSTLLLLGAGPDQEYFEQTAAALGIRDRVLFHPFVPVSEVVRYLNLMDMLVLPSLTVPEWKEQLGRVLLEAMACEIPVIGSSSGEIPRVIGNTGLVYPEGDSAALAGALLQYLRSADLRRRCALAGKQRVLQEYTNEQVARKMYDLYRRVLAT